MKILPKKISEVANFINGFPFKPSDWENEGYPIIRIQNLSDPTKPYNRTTKVVPAKYLVRKGDILVSWSATIDVFEWQDNDAYLNQHIFKVEFDEEKVEKTYFKLALRKTIYDLIKFAHGATMKHVVKGDFDNHEIPLPLLADQIRIAAVLTRAEKLIARRKESIKALDELLKSTFLEMFGDPVRNEKGWHRDCLKNLCGFITKGTTPKNKDIFDVFDNGLIPFIKVYHICNDGSMNFNYNPSFINQKTHNEYLKRSIVYQDDILMNIVGPPLGKIALVPKIFQEWNVNQAIAIFRCAKNLNPRYLLFTLKSRNFCNAIIKTAVGIRQQNLSLEQCRDINVPVPPLPLQNQFAAIVEKVELLKTRSAESLTELENLYGSLSQRAFKGELDLSRVPAEIA